MGKSDKFLDPSQCRVYQCAESFQNYYTNGIILSPQLQLQSQKFHQVKKKIKKKLMPILIHVEIKNLTLSDRGTILSLIKIICRTMKRILLKIQDKSILSKV